MSCRGAGCRSRLTNLGIVQEQLGELEAARGSQQRALAIKQTVYGPEHPQVAITLGNLGIVQQQLGELEAAREGAVRALAIFERFLGPEHPTTRQAHEHLARLEAGAADDSDAA
jgi:Tfp pilus assembly protein PilF